MDTRQTPPPQRNHSRLQIPTVPCSTGPNVMLLRRRLAVRYGPWSCAVPGFGLPLVILRTCVWAPPAFHIFYQDPPPLDCAVDVTSRSRSSFIPGLASAPLVPLRSSHTAGEGRWARSFAIHQDPYQILGVSRGT
eukprot:gene3229-3749_t